MPTTTTRLGLAQPETTDASSELRVAITGNATILDNASMVFSGTLANRGTVVPSPALGVTYYATDVNVEFFYNGSAWVPVPLGPNMTTMTSSGTAVQGKTIIASAGVTVTLPSAASTVLPIVVVGNSVTTALDPVLVSASGSDVIYGARLGFAGSSSFYLSLCYGVTLVSDGTSWRIVSGIPSLAGWVNISLASGVIANGATPRVRVEGDRMFLGGSALNNSGSTITAGNYLGSEADIYDPFGQVLTTWVSTSAGGSPSLMRLSFSSTNIVVQSAWPAGQVIWLDGLNWSLTF